MAEVNMSISNNLENKTSKDEIGLRLLLLVVVVVPVVVDVTSKELAKLVCRL